MAINESRGIMGVGLLLMAGCGLVDPEPPRPECSESDPRCGEGWVCAEEVRPLCPRFCDPTYTCYAQGILEVGWSCLRDSECVDGAHCGPSDDGATCRLIECRENADCGDTERCDDYECVTTLGEGCADDRDVEYGCSAGEICSDLVCTEPPAEGENDCEDDSYCADGLICRYDGECGILPEDGGNRCGEDSDCAAGLACTTDHTGVDRCTSCLNDRDCDDPALPFCQHGHCGLCSDASCGEQVCIPSEGCFECQRTSDCPIDDAYPYYCEAEDRTCRVWCDRFEDEDCPPSSGQCSFGEYCVRDLGTPCSELGGHSEECFDGFCADRTASGSSVDPYCTRTCSSGDLPCGAGSVCVEDAEVSGEVEDVCLAM